MQRTEVWSNADPRSFGISSWRSERGSNRLHIRMSSAGTTFDNSRWPRRWLSSKSIDRLALEQVAEVVRSLGMREFPGYNKWIDDLQGRVDECGGMCNLNDGVETFPHFWTDTSGVVTAVQIVWKENHCPWYWAQTDISTVFFFNVKINKSVFNHKLVPHNRAKTLFWRSNPYNFSFLNHKDWVSLTKLFRRT